MFGRLFSKSKSVSSGSGDPEPSQKKVTTPSNLFQHAANQFLASLLNRPPDTATMIDCDLPNSVEGLIAFVGLVGRLQVFRFQVGPHIGDGKFWPCAYCTLHSYRTSLRH